MKNPSKNTEASVPFNDVSCSFIFFVFVFVRCNSGFAISYTSSQQKSSPNFIIQNHVENGRRILLVHKLFIPYFVTIITLKN